MNCYYFYFIFTSKTQFYITVIFLVCRDACIPATTLLVGANLLKGNYHHDLLMFIFIRGVFGSIILEMNKILLTYSGFFFPGLKGSGMKLPLVVGIIVVRYIALPLFGVAIIKGAIHVGIIHHDPFYQFFLIFIASICASACNKHK